MKARLFHSSDKAGCCTFCMSGVLAGEIHAELKLTTWSAGPGRDIPRHDGLLMICEHCYEELGLDEHRPARESLMRIVQELIVREDFSTPALPDPEPFSLETYEPASGFTDDGLEIPRRHGDKTSKTLH